MITATSHSTNVTLEALSTSVDRPENAGSRWQGMPHQLLAKTIIERVDAQGWTVDKTQFAINKSGSDMAGAFQLTVPGLQGPDGISLGLGVLHSNNRRRALRLVVGGTVFVCTNGCVTGELLLRKQHDRSFSLSDSIDEALGGYVQQAGQLAASVDNMREMELTPAQSDALLLEVGRSKMMPWSRVGKVDQEYRHPTFSDHGKGTAWALYNAFTYHVKNNPPTRQMEDMNTFREMLYATAA